MKVASLSWVRLTGLVLLVATCGNDKNVVFDWKLPLGFPEPSVPAENPMTVEKVELGRYLFYDKRLSGNGTQSCGTCHQQALGFSDGKALAIGSTNQIHPRGSMGLTNVAYNATLAWANPALAFLEQQIPLPLFGETPVEMGVTGHEDEVLARLRTDAIYQQRFDAAFPDAKSPVTFPNVVAAIASFSRTLISGNSPFDRFTYHRDTNALTPGAIRGMNLFFTERLECFHCHGGFNFAVATIHKKSAFDERAFHNTGLYNIGGSGAYPPGNQGLFEHTGQRDDAGKFRAPSLRNVALTAPYMHDGSVATLAEVLDFYGAGGRLIETGSYAGDGRLNPNKNRFVPGFVLTPEEKSDVLEFLGSLTDRDFIANPAFSDPFLSR
jgi:cytochrome c peroxidase